MGGATIMIFNNIFSGDREIVNWENFWSELSINYSMINETSDLKDILSSILSNLQLIEIKSISSILGLEIIEKEKMISEILRDNRSLDIVYLNIFLKRKKKAIEDMYNYFFYNEDANYLESTTLVKLFHIFITDHTYMFDIVALSEWKSRGTGVEYITDKIVKELFIKLTGKENLDKLCSFMSKTPKIGTEYKIRMICNYNNKTIFVIYKLKNDAQKTDFDESKRIKDIEKILFELDMENASLHIKARTIGERDQLKKYLEKYFHCEFKEFESSVFENYDPNEFKDVFYSLNNSNKKEVANFYVNKMTFLNSLLDKSPEVTFSTPKRDVWPSIVHAFEMRVLDIDSLYSIKDMNINVNTKSRSIRTIILKDGSVIFKLDDKGLSLNDFEIINNKFKAKFGIPLNKRIRNKLDRGRADEIDLILRCTTTKQIENINQESIQKLKNDKIIKIETLKKIVCKDSACGAEIAYSNEVLKECPECSNDDLDIQICEEISINHKKIEDFVKDFLCNSIRLEKKDIGKSQKFNNEYRIIRFLFNDREYNVFITNKIIPRKIIKSIEK